MDGTAHTGILGDRGSRARGALVFVMAGILIGLFEARPAAQANAPLIISEFRLRGPNGIQDEFVEIYNPRNNPVTITTSSAGYALVASDGIVRFIIPNGTIIPGRGHYLGTNSVGYSLSSYPAGPSLTATGDATYTANIGDNAGIALFKSSTTFDLANRLDAVGSTSEANTLYKEGSGYGALSPFSIDYSFHRALLDGFPKDTDNNAADFVFVDTNGTSAGAGQRLGAPGPENLSSPVQTGSGIDISAFDPGADIGAPPNVVRDFTSDPPNNSTFGTLVIRRLITNHTGTTITRLRFRISFIQTFPSASGFTDLRPRTIASASVPLTGGGSRTAFGTTLEVPPLQPNGGGHNSSISVPVVVGPGVSFGVQFLFGLQQTGKYVISMNVEALPTGGNSAVQIAGDSEGCHTILSPTLATFGPAGGSSTIGVNVAGGCAWSVTQAPIFAVVNSGSTGNGSGVVAYSVAGGIQRLRRVSNFIVGYAVATILQLGRALSDFELDGKADVVVYRPSTGQWWVRRSINNFTDSIVVPWGVEAAGDIPAPADFDGDGKTDPTVYRPGSSGTSFWFVDRSSTNYTSAFSVRWGDATDVPLPGYYDADDKADPTVFRPSTGQWFINRSITGYADSFTVQWGVSTDVPVPADYDGDGRTDIAIYRPSTGQWFILRSDSEFTAMMVQQWGVQAQADVPLPADYDGDGKADPTVYRPGTGQWFVLQSNSGYFNSFSTQWGVQAVSDQPLPADFDGDGKADPTVYRPGTGQWFIKKSSTIYSTSLTVPWGSQASGDIPIRER